MSKDDYTLWKAWWYAAMYGAEPSERMRMIDNLRAGG